MQFRRFHLRAGHLVLILLFSVRLHTACAGSATWSANPGSNTWNTAANWTPNTVPNTASDVATFAFSNTTNVTVPTRIIVNSVVFDPAASAYTITAAALQPLTISGAGISNNSGVAQNFQINPAAEINLSNTATISADTRINVLGSPVTSGAAGLLVFNNGASAGDATIIGNPTSAVALPTIDFTDASSAGNATITLSGGPSLAQRFAAALNFLKTSSAAQSNLTCGGAGVATAQGGFIFFLDNSSAGSATITANGGTASDAPGGLVEFRSATSSATLIANGGTNGGLGGAIRIFANAADAQPRVELFGNGNLTITLGITVGSLEGDGLVFLGGSNLTVGGNGLSTTFSGVLQDGTFQGGSLTKTGAGILTLSGANLYTGSTSISQGTVVVANKSGSATGTGALVVNAGTLGGSGTVSGAVTVGTSNGPGAFLAPAAGGKKQATFTSASLLTLNADATYTYTAKAKTRKALTDKVVVNGVTINGATFSFRPKLQGTLGAGLVFTVIENTAAPPIAGTFGNLADGAIITAGGNNFQVSYEGGDGNDLTLTVVP